jgi:hypothetical protein
MSFGERLVKRSGEPVVLGAEEEERAERASRANHGLGRRPYEGMAGLLGVGSVYLEVTPA